MAKQFEVEEFEAIFRRYKDMVFKTAYLMLGDAQEAEDVLQEVFVKVYKSWDDFDPQKGKFNTWLHRITVNQCISERRGKRSASFSVEGNGEQSFELADARSQPPEELLMKQEESERIKRAMRSLDRKHRVILALRYFDDLSYDEVAQVLEIPLGTVKSRLNAAIRALKTELAGGGLHREM